MGFLTENVDEAVKKILELGGPHEVGESGDWGSVAYCADLLAKAYVLLMNSEALRVVEIEI